MKKNQLKYLVEYRPKKKTRNKRKNIIEKKVFNCVFGDEKAQCKLKSL